MKIVSYSSEKNCLNKYFCLIKNIYSEYPVVVAAKIEEAKKALNSKNPFLRHGRWKNFLLMNGEEPAAHISAITDRRLPAGSGLIGFFECKNNSEYFKKISDAALRHLEKNHKNNIYGPVNLTTWQNFRVSYPEKYPPFYLEPFTRAFYKKLFAGYGFKVNWRNISTAQAAEETGFGAYRDYFKYLKKSGFMFEEVKKENLLQAMDEIRNIIIKSFKNTALFINISLEEFIYNFKGVLLSKKGNNYFLQIARDKNKKAAAFLWGAQDLYSAKGKRLVLKTMGVLPEFENIGMGRALFYTAYLRAKKENLPKIIFSTMRADNEKIIKLAGSEQKIYREYEAYGLRL